VLTIHSSLADPLSLRVVHVCAYFAPAFVYGGPPRSILGLCVAQQQAGLDVRVLTTTANGDGELPVTGKGFFEGVPVRYCRRAWPRATFRAPSLGRSLRRLLPSADVVHVHGLWNAAVWAAAAETRKAGRPYLVSPRGMLTSAALAHDAWRKRLSYLAFDRRLIRGAAMFHATSQSEFDELKARFGADRTCCVPNGVDMPPKQLDACAVRRRFGLGSAPVVLFLGRVHPIKRLDLLATAFSRVREQHPQARLVIAGPDEGGHRASLAPVFAPLEDSVIWTGEVTPQEKWNLLDASSMLVLCSNSESFGMSAAEAMAASRPVVVTRTCSWPGVEREQTGFWVEQSAASIAAAVTDLLAKPDVAAEMGRRGRALIERQYNWTIVARQLTAVYERVASGAARG
jgi:glycosyltransferase involved in cell wall biosynthesis